MPYYDLKYLVEWIRHDLTRSPSDNLLSELSDLAQKIETIENKVPVEIVDCYRLLMYAAHKTETISAQYYHVYWNYKKAIDITKSKKRNAVDVDLNSLFFDEANTEFWKINKYLNESDIVEPIIVLDYKPTKELIVIDGNHRCSIRKKRGHTSISAFVLSYEELEPALHYAEARIFYDFHLKFCEYIQINS